MILGLFLGEYPEHSAAGLFILGVLAGAVSAHALDEAGLAFAGTFRRLAGVRVAATAQHQPGDVRGRAGDGDVGIGAAARAHRQGCRPRGFVA